MILADENIDPKLIEAIRALGIDVKSIFESERGMEDEDIINLSRIPPRIILTEDKDFGEWVFAHHIKEVSVVLLRYHFRDTEKMKHILLELFSKERNTLYSKFTTVSIEKIRTRSI